MPRRSISHRRRQTRYHPSKRLRLSFPRIDYHRLLAWFLPVILIIIITFFTISPFMHIKAHSCHYLNNQPCPPIIEAELDRFHGQNMLTFSPDKLEQKLLAVDPQSQQVDISIDFPHSFSVRFLPQTILANIKVATNSAHLLVSRQHTVVGQSTQPQPSLPVIIDPQAVDLRIGDRISNSPLAFTLNMIESLNKSFINIQQTYIYSDKLILVKLDRDRQAIFTTHADLSRQVTSLQLILSKATIMKDLPVIDLRFDQPVLRPYR